MPRERNLGAHGRPTYDQASKIIARFGGESHLARSIGVSRITIYRWTYKRPLGTDGLVPSKRIDAIKKVARMEGVLIRPDDWVPRTIDYEKNPPPAAQPKRNYRLGLADLLA